MAGMAVAICGCESPQRVQRIEFPVAEYESLPKEGTGIVRGQAFLRTRGGDVKVAAGSTVMLNPVTSYSLQWYREGYIGKRPMEPVDPRIDAYVKHTVADAEGRFEFVKVPAGEYFATTSVVWEAPTGYHGGLIPQGGWVSQRLSVKNDEETKVILTR
jgi:hypothetical protein